MHFIHTVLSTNQVFFHIQEEHMLQDQVAVRCLPVLFLSPNHAVDALTAEGVPTRGDDAVFEWAEADAARIVFR